MAVFFQLGVNERLKQFQSHLLGKTALVQLKFWAHHNNGTTRVIDALTQQVLTETTLLTFKHIGQGFQRTLVSTRDSPATTSVIEQRIYSFLKHALFVTHDNIGRTQLHQALQTVITVDDATIQIVQIRRCKTPTIQRHQRTQIRRNNRNQIQNHPFWAGTAFCKRFNQLQALNELFALSF